jgi:hypothetical protein
MRANASPRKGKLKTMKKLSALMLGAAMILGTAFAANQAPTTDKPATETTKTTKKAHVKKTKKSKKNAAAAPAATPAPTK